MKDPKDIKVGQLINFIFKRTQTSHWARVQYIDDEVIKLGSPPISNPDGSTYKRKKSQEKTGSTYFLDEIEIL